MVLDLKIHVDVFIILGDDMVVDYINIHYIQTFLQVHVYIHDYVEVFPLNFVGTVFADDFSNAMDLSMIIVGNKRLVKMIVSIHSVFIDNNVVG